MLDNWKRHFFVFWKFGKLVCRYCLLNLRENFSLFIPARKPDEDLTELIKALISSFKLTSVQIFPNSKKKRHDTPECG